jgi:hypothetical protein
MDNIPGVSMGVEVNHTHLAKSIVLSHCRGTGKHERVVTTQNHRNRSCIKSLSYLLLDSRMA